MKETYRVVLAVGWMLVSATVMSADWTIMQATTLNTGAEPVLRQGNVTVVTGSIQAYNAIQLNTTEDSLISGSQLSTITAGTSLTLTQGGLVSESIQALNFIEAQNIGENGAGAVTQTVTSTSTATTLIQSTAGAGAGTLNVQSLNFASGNGVINELTQTITENGTLSLQQNDVPTNENHQAVNYATAATFGVDTNNGLSQDSDVVGKVTMSQTGSGAENQQSMNSIVGLSTAGTIAYATQDFTAQSGVDMDQDAATGGDNVQAFNLADTRDTVSASANIDHLDQKVTVNGTVTIDINSASANNIQSGNVALSGGDIAHLSQTYTAGETASTLTFTHSAVGSTNLQALNVASAAENITTTDGVEQSVDAATATSLLFDMNTAANSNTQAGNITRIGGTGNSISEISQEFTGSATANVFTQSSAANNLLQAGNLLELGTGSLTDTTGPHQSFTSAGTVAMTQQSGITGTTGGTDNLQTLNAVTDTAGGTVAVNLQQTATITGSTFTMAQNGVTTSGAPKITFEEWFL